MLSDITNELKKYKNIRRWIKNPRKHLANFLQRHIQLQPQLQPQLKPQLQQFNHSLNAKIISQQPKQKLPVNIQDTIPPNKFIHKDIKYYKTGTGSYYLPADAPLDIIIHYIKAGKIFEPEIVETAGKYITKGSTVLDIGANLGQMSLLFSKMTGPEGQVLSFEADDFIFYLLQKNITANRCENIRAFYGGVFDKSKDMMYYPEPTFERFGTYGSYGLDPNASSGRKVPTLTIDDLDIQSPISFMKVDIQGSDLFALKGAIKTIERHQMPIIFEYEEQFQEEFQVSFQDYLDFIHSISYKVVKVVNQINYLIMPDKRKTSVEFTSSKIEPIYNELRLSNAPLLNKVCKLLKSKNEIEECTDFLHRNGFVSHNLACKDWEIAHIISAVEDGNFLEMGSSDSYILKNISLKRIKGEKYGIDLNQPDVPITEVKYLVGDLMKTGLPSEYFKNISCSVLEHQMDFDKFASEVNRLLEPKGKLFVTFDYWEPKITAPMKLCNLVWQPLDRETLVRFINVCQTHNLHLIQDFDYTLRDPVIQWGYYSPYPDMAYTFGMAVFEKRV